MSLKHGFRRLVLLCGVGLLLVGCALANPPDTRPFDDKADANAVLEAALTRSRQSGKPVLITFGANWCKDSRALASHYEDPELAAYLREHFEPIYIDVGMYHRNLDIVERVGNPIDEGIPAIAVMNGGGQLLFSTADGELASSLLHTLGWTRDFMHDVVERHVDIER